MKSDERAETIKQLKRDIEAHLLSNSCSATASSLDGWQNTKVWGFGTAESHSFRASNPLPPKAPGILTRILLALGLAKLK